MSSDEGFVTAVVDSMEHAGAITWRKMFGEYAIYSDGKVVALVCDNQLFVRPTEGGRAFLGEVTAAPPYPGAKDHFLIDELGDRAWLGELIRITAGELRAAPPKRKGRSQKKGR